MEARVALTEILRARATSRISSNTLTKIASQSTESSSIAKQKWTLRCRRVTCQIVRTQATIWSTFPRMWLALQELRSSLERSIQGWRRQSSTSSGTWRTQWRKSMSSSPTLTLSISKDWGSLTKVASTKDSSKRIKELTQTCLRTTNRLFSLTSITTIYSSKELTSPQQRTQW